MDSVKIQTKRILSQVRDYFSQTNNLTKAETHCLKDMKAGILKSKSMFVNQIAAYLRESIPLKKTTKRLSAQPR